MQSVPPSTLLLLVIPITGLLRPRQLDDSDLQSPTKVNELIETHRLDCHRGAGAERNLRLDEPPFDLREPTTSRAWVRLHNRVAAGEMPPPDAGPPDQQDGMQAVSVLAASFQDANDANQQQFGRGQLRRLNHMEYKSTLHDLRHLPHLEVREMLPPDASAYGVDHVRSALDLSYVQMSRYLEAAEQS